MLPGDQKLLAIHWERLLGINLKLPEESWGQWMSRLGNGLEGKRQKILISKLLKKS